jgi:N-acetylglutamate synthase
MTVKFCEMKIEDYQEIFIFWLSVEGIGLHAYCDSLDGIIKYLQRNPGLSFVARDGKKIVGTILCGHDGRRGYLHHLAVAYEYRKKGIGKTLVQMSLSQLKLLGIAKCHLFVFDKNKDAQLFWQNIGWTNRVDLKTMSKNID